MRLTPLVAFALATSLQAQPAATDQIESFGFDTRAKMGLGGFMALDVYPVVLFRDGTALTDVTGLTDPAAHRRANPDAWRRWRRSNDALEVEGKSGWKALAFRTTYPKLPDGFRLDGRFQSLGGTGNVAVGGSQSVAVWSDYTFTPDGRVTRGGGAGATGASGNTSIATSAVAPNRRGRYTIEGLTLRITYDDGSSENRILITDPKDAESVIWLDGVSYTRKKNR